MTDIQQWRRRIQPTRARTPAPALEPDDTDDMASPSTPKQCLKSKVSSYFDFRQHAKTSSLNEEFEPQLPTWPTDQLYPDPDAEDEMDSIMCVLMSDPYARLDVRFNGALMRIFEKFMELKEEKDLLQKRVDQEIASSQAVLSRLNMAEKDWEDDRRDYKDEIRRLEILLSKVSKRGVAEVTLARQDSKLRRDRKFSDKKETVLEVFDLLDRDNRYNERYYSSQRATMKPILQSPCEKDKALSQRLAQKKSITNIHAELPFGTPPDRDEQFSLAHVSMLEQQDPQRKRPRAVTSSTDTSGDTFSAFSCEVAFPQEQANLDNKAPVSDLDADKELAEIVRLATVVARRRSIDSAQVLPQLLGLFKAHRGTRADSAGTLSSMPDIFPSPSATPKPAATTRILSRTGTAPAKRQLMSKASGLFNKFKPQQLSVDTAESIRGGQRRFSFEPGDDTLIESLKPGGSALGAHDRLLRKSISCDILPQSTPTSMMEQALSPVAASPTASVAADRPPSRIPTPVYSSGSLARPRQDREDSSSSLLTAIRVAGDPSKRTSSLCSSSVYSSPSASREELGKTGQGEAISLQDALGSSNRLLDHTNSLRGSTILSPAARAASAYPEGSYGPRTPGNKASAGEHSSASSSKPDMSDIRKENSRPMSTGARARDPPS